MHDLETWLQLPDIYDRAVMSDTHGRQLPPPEMDERRVRPAMRGREIRPLDLPTRGRGKMPQATFVPQSRGMLQIHQSGLGGISEAEQLEQLLQQSGLGGLSEAELMQLLKLAPGMLDRIDGRIIPRPGPVRPKTPMNGGVRG